MQRPYIGFAEYQFSNSSGDYVLRNVDVRKFSRTGRLYGQSIAPTFIYSGKLYVNFCTCSTAQAHFRIDENYKLVVNPLSVKRKSIFGISLQ